MGKVDADLLFSWSTVFSIGGIAFALLAVALALFIAARPRWFWPMLIVAGIVGCGPRIGGYFFLDEIISSAVVLGALLRLAGARTKRTGNYSHAKNVHCTWFYVWIVFMIMESIFGVIYNEDLRIIRWILFYTMLGVIAWIINNRDYEFPFPSFEAVSVTIVSTTLLLYVAYLAQGMYFESILGLHGRFLSQDMVWAGSAYAVYPTLLAAPAALLLTNNYSRRIRALAWAAIAMIMVIALYYDSRISWLVIIGTFFAGLHRLKLRNMVLVVSIFLVSFALYMPDPLKNVVGFGQGILESVQALWNPSESDVTRNLQLQVGFLRIADNPKTFLIGDGVYSHRFTAIPHMDALYSEYLQYTGFSIPGSRDDSRGMDIFRTVGFTAMLIDTGVIGMFLFILNWLFVGKKVLKSAVSNKALFLAIITMSFMWLLSNNITDITLFYLLIMPKGLIERWSQCELGTKPATS